MGGRNLCAMIFLFANILTCEGEDCETYDDNGLCLAPCKNGRVFYSAGCLDPTMSERTCREPKARSLGILCDYNRCECPQPKVWDEAARKCVKAEECSDQSKVTCKTDEMP